MAHTTKFNYTIPRNPSVVLSHGTTFSYNSDTGLWVDIGNISEEKILDTPIYPDFFNDKPEGFLVGHAFLSIKEVTYGPVWQFAEVAPHHKQVWKIASDPTFEDMPQDSLFARYLNSTFHAGQAAILQQALGATLIGAGRKVHQAVFLTGQGRGKSTFLDIAQRLIPPEATASIWINKNLRDTEIAGLALKTLNIVDDLPLVKNEEITAMFKEVLISGAQMRGRRLYGNPFSFRPNCVHIFAGTRLPEAKDAAAQRRCKVINVENIINSADIIPNLGKKIVKEELGIVLNWACEGAFNLVKNNYQLLPR